MNAFNHHSLKKYYLLLTTDVYRITEPDLSTMFHRRFWKWLSSLNLLKDMNADTLKLDKAFFASPKADVPRERVIIESVVNLAKKLSMKTVAEGGETLEQMGFLEEINCDMVQGYVISKPVDAESFEKLVFGI